MTAEEALAAKVTELSRAAAREEIIDLLERLYSEPGVPFEVRTAAKVVMPFFVGAPLEPTTE